MHSPPEAIHTACWRAALATTVPVSLLEALAFVASGYDPRKEGPARGNDEAPGKGLFLLGPRVLEQLKVSDPFDPVANARAAADVLRALGDRYAWREPDMIVGFIWGGSKFSAWMSKEPTKRTPLPAAVKAKLEETLAARRWLLERAEPTGADEWEKLDSAITGALAANASWPPAQELAAEWKRTAAALRAPGPKIPGRETAGLRHMWERYRDLFKRLPVTDSRTPQPTVIDPGPHMPTKDDVVRLASRVGEGLGGAVVLLLLIAVAARR